MQYLCMLFRYLILHWRMSVCLYVEISPLSYNQQGVVWGTAVALFCFVKQHYNKMDTTVDNLLYSILCSFGLIKECAAQGTEDTLNTMASAQCTDTTEQTQTHYNQTYKHNTMGTTSWGYSTTAPQKQLRFIHPSTQTNSFPCIPVIALPHTFPFLSPQTGTAKSFCSVLLSHLLSLQNKLIRADVFTSRGWTEKSHPHLGTSPPLPPVPSPFPTLSECWQLFRLLCRSQNRTFLPWQVFTRLPSKTRYGWVLLACFLCFTVANCNLNSPANLINLYATTMNMKFHGIFFLGFFPAPQKWSNKIRPEEAG